MTILSDDVFVQYGGHTGTSTAAQRTAAYTIAERQARQYLGTFVEVTTVTGTFPWPLLHGVHMRLPHDRLAGVVSVTAVHEVGCNCATDASEYVGCAWVHDFDAAIIELRETATSISSGCSCSCSQAGGAIQARVVYNAGLPAEAHTDPAFLLGMVTAADLALEQMIDPAGAEGGPGDPGVQSFGAAGYTESRTPLKDTVFGSSARANYAARMLRPWKLKTGLKLGW